MGCFFKAKVTTVGFTTSEEVNYMAVSVQLIEVGE